MYRRRSNDLPSTSRKGTLFIGALREIGLIGLVLGLLLMAIAEASSLVALSTSSKDSATRALNLEPILNLDFDRDQRMLVAHTYPEGIDQIRLSNALSTKRVSPQNLFSTATSDHNSTTIMLTQWTDNNRLHHGVYILRREEMIHSEEFVLKELSTADARISSDGTIAMIITHVGTVIGWDLTESPPTRWEFHLGRQSATNQMSPDGRRFVIAANDGNPLVCDCRSGEILCSLPFISGCCRSAAWSVDGQRLSLGDESGNVFVYDAATGQLVWTDKIDFLFARSIALSDDGGTIAIGGFDKKIRIWNLSERRDAPQRILENTSVVNDLLFIDDKLVAACLDGTIREWSLISQLPPRQIR